MAPDHLRSVRFDSGKICLPIRPGKIRRCHRFGIIKRYSFTARIANPLLVWDEYIFILNFRGQGGQRHVMNASRIGV
jgi:hypothetical protein